MLHYKFVRRHYMYEFVTLYDNLKQAILLNSCYFIYASYIVTISMYCTSCCQCTWIERNKERFDLIYNDQTKLSSHSQNTYQTLFATVT